MIIKIVLKTWLCLLLISVCLAATGQAQTIPAFTFIREDKTRCTQQQLEKGKILFFIFFDAACDHCQHAIGFVSQHIQEFRNTALYLITLDNTEKARLFLSKYGRNLNGQQNVTLLQDPNKDFIRLFSPRKYPSLFLYSKNHQLLLYDDNEQNLPVFLQIIQSSLKQ